MSLHIYFPCSSNRRTRACLPESWSKLRLELRLQKGPQIGKYMSESNFTSGTWAQHANAWMHPWWPNPQLTQYNQSNHALLTTLAYPLQFSVHPRLYSSSCKIFDLHQGSAHLKVFLAQLARVLERLQCLVKSIVKHPKHITAQW